MIEENKHSETPSEIKGSTQSFEFKINGEDVSPGNVSLRELLQVLSLMSSAVGAVGGKDAEYELSLTSIVAGSLKCQVTAKPQGFQAVNQLTTALASDDLLKLSPKVLERIRDIWKFTYQRGWDSVSFHPNGSNLIPAEIRADQEVPGLSIVKGWTSLYGFCDRAGGSQNRTAQIRPVGKKNLITVRLGSQKLAKELGERLYETVGLDGIATWEAKTGKLVVFKAEKLNEYSDRDKKSPPRSIKQAFNNLANVTGDRWDNVDPDEFLKGLRDE